jgi:hypothetical protein
MIRTSFAMSDAIAAIPIDPLHLTIRRSSDVSQCGTLCNRMVFVRCSMGVAYTRFISSLDRTLDPGRHARRAQERAKGGNAEDGIGRAIGSIAAPLENLEGKTFSIGRAVEVEIFARLSRW